MSAHDRACEVKLAEPIDAELDAGRLPDHKTNSFTVKRSVFEAVTLQSITMAGRRAF